MILVNVSEMFASQFPKPPATASDLMFEKYFVEDGLPSNSVMALHQDSKGFIWIGSNDGLLRFDGYELITYRSIPGDSNSLSHNAIWDIMEDHEGYLWIGTEEGGLNRFDPAIEKFTRYVHDPEDDHSIGAGFIVDVLEDSHNVIWAGTTEGGLSRFDRKAGEFQSFRSEESDPEGHVSEYAAALFEDSLERLWVMYRGTGLHLLNRTTNKFKSIGFPGSTETPIKVSSAMVEDSNGGLWISGMGDGLFRMRVEPVNEDSVNVYLEPAYDPGQIPGSHVPFRMTIDPWDRIWLATWGAGLLEYDTRTEQLSQVDLGDQSSSFSNIYVHSLLVDRNATIWAGTDWGLNKADLNQKMFWQYEFGEINGLTSNVFRLLEDSKADLWMAAGGLVHMQGGFQPDQGWGDLTIYLHDPEDEKSLPQGSIQCLIEDQDKNIWLGMRGGGLAVLEESTGTFTRFEQDATNPGGLENNTVSALHQDSKGQIWLGTQGSGLHRLEDWASGGNAVFSHYHFGSVSQENRDLLRVWYIHETGDGDFWVATRGGLLQYDPGADAVKAVYWHDYNNSASIPDNTIDYISEDEKGNLWLSTGNSGLVKFDRNTKAFTTYDTRSGLPSNELNQSHIDDQGLIWLATPAGITRFDPEAEHFQIFNDMQGISRLQYDACVRSQSGLMYLGSQEGLIVFDADRSHINPIPPQIAFTQFSLFNEPVLLTDLDSPLTTHISHTEHLKLAHDQNVMTFVFAALHFTQPALNQYAYQLSGFDERWFDLGDRRELTFTNLDAGDYHLRVKAANSDGVWSREPAVLGLTILAPWWKTRIAILAYVLLGLTILAFIRRYEMNRQQVKRELEMEKVEAQKLLELDTLKTRFFANISHEFRTPLTIILGQLETLLEGSSNDETSQKLSVAQRSGRRLLQLINQLLDLSKLEAHKMNLKASKRDIVTFLRGVIASFESLALQKDLQLAFVPKVETLEIMFDGELLERVCINLLSNAIKFTPPKGRIALTLSSEIVHEDQYDYVLLEFTDTGIGIPEDRLEHIFDRFYQVDGSQTRDQEGTGIGLALVKELVELHHGRVNLSSQIGKGTQFQILLPADAGAFRPDELVSDDDTGAPLAQQPLDTDQITGVKKAEEPPPDDSREIILLVEDNVDIRNHIQELLADQYSIIQAGDGVEGLELAGATIPDLIITDVMMPRMDGTEFTKAIRKDERSSHVPIIMLTARAADDDKISGLEIGVDDYLIKPFNPKELRTRIRNLLDMRSRLRQQFSKALVIKPKEVSAVPADQQFMTRLLAHVEANMGEEDYSVDVLANYMGVSVRTLSRKLKALIDQSPAQLIRSMRLQRGAELLKKKVGNIAEIAYQIGFSDQAHFTRSFKKEFDQSPSEYMKSDNKTQE